MVVFYAALCASDFRTDYTKDSYTYLSLVSPPQFLSFCMHALFSENFRESLYLNDLDVLPLSTRAVCVRTCVLVCVRVCVCVYVRNGTIAATPRLSRAG